MLVLSEMSLYGNFSQAKDALTKAAIGYGRPVSYAVNGTGRDTYISLDNGGLYKTFEPFPSAEVGTFRFKRMHENSLATIEPKAVGYFPNGTGRDTYIA